MRAPVSLIPFHPQSESEWIRLGRIFAWNVVTLTERLAHLGHYVAKDKNLQHAFRLEKGNVVSAVPLLPNNFIFIHCRVQGRSPNNLGRADGYINQPNDHFKQDVPKSDALALFEIQSSDVKSLKQDAIIQLMEDFRNAAMEAVKADPRREYNIVYVPMTDANGNPFADDADPLRNRAVRYEVKAKHCEVYSNDLCLQQSLEACTITQRPRQKDLRPLLDHLAGNDVGRRYSPVV